MWLIGDTAVHLKAVYVLWTQSVVWTDSKFQTKTSDKNGPTGDLASETFV